MKKPEVIEATYRIVTPMFIGDANQQATGITAASIKGALRFWWRALNWGRVREECENDVEALKTLHEEEAELFGSSAYDNKQRRKEGKQSVGQSKVLLHVKQPPDLVSLDDWPVAPKNKPKADDSSYLGMGLWDTKETVHRKALLENQTFTVEVIYKHLKESQRDQLLQTLKVFGLVGGLGGRSRRGFGSISVENIDGADYQCNSIDQYLEQIKSIFSDIKCLENYPPFTAFSTKFRIVRMKDSINGARNCHNKIGSMYKDFRVGLDKTKRKILGLPIKMMI